MESLAYLHTALAYEEPQEATPVLRPQLTKIITQYQHHKIVIGVRTNLFLLVLVLSIFGLAEDALAKNVIRKGSQGQDVTFLQQKLAEVGLYNGPINGKFGLLTESAVKRFQLKNGLQADGIVGNNTWSKLEQHNISGGQYPYFGNPNQVPGLPDRFANLPSYYKVYVKKGDSGSKVKYIQEELKFRGFYQGKVDGIYGLQTEDAVKSFQASRNLALTGLVDEATLRELQRPATGFELTSNLKSPSIETKQNVTTLQPGDVGQPVKVLQSKLRDLGYNPGPIDGSYGPSTQDALRHFQRDRGLRVNGIAGRETLIALGLINDSSTSPQQQSRYVVIIPDRDGKVCSQLRQRGFTRARWQDSSLGRFVNVGEYGRDNRNDAELYAQRLRDMGFDARVAYSGNFSRSEGFISC